MSYDAFRATKGRSVDAVGIEVAPDAIHPSLHGFQRDLVRWALRKGRAAIFSTTGTGKTRMQLEWARLSGERVLIVAPLAVAQQTVREAGALGIELTYARSQADAADLTITNYEMVHHFDAAQFGAVVLDESSILKAMDGKLRTALIRQFAATPYRLCCTATPAPNDLDELGNHAEFLGILTLAEMRATFFVNDQGTKERIGWRLKGHAREPFYRWLASWGMTLTRPSDLGYPNDGYDLPPLTIVPMILATDYRPPGQLFATSLHGITDRAAVRKQTIAERVTATAALVAQEPDEPWLLWPGLNEEADRLTAAIPGAVNVQGSMTPEAKADALLAFADGHIPVLVTKPSIAAFGLNLQHCARMAFVGLSDSYEQYFQAIRRCWRYGQTREVKCFIVLTEPEEVIYENVLRKEREAATTARELVKHVAEYEKAQLGQARHRVTYDPSVPMTLPNWLKGFAA
ncbi:MAG TPA: DEAD/DEAH box helicase [Tepidisphaeraceae bacterium]|jgi:hypothetical protein